MRLHDTYEMSPCVLLCTWHLFVFFSAVFQLIKLCQTIVQSAGLDLYLDPYSVLPTGYEQGIIQVVPNTESRTQAGELADGGLVDIFKQKFGAPGSPAFENARQSLIRSTAG